MGAQTKMNKIEITHFDVHKYNIENCSSTHTHIFILYCTHAIILINSCIYALTRVCASLKLFPRIANMELYKMCRINARKRNQHGVLLIYINIYEEKKTFKEHTHTAVGNRACILINPCSLTTPVAQLISS